MSEQIPHDDPQIAQGPQHRGKIVIVVLIVVVVAVWGMLSRLHDDRVLRKTTNDQAVPEVVLYTAVHSTRDDDVVLPGTIQAWHDAPIYARTSGYLKDWVTDIGAHVKAGDLLAEIDTPEVDAQLHQAEADLATAEANNNLAQSTAKRWEDLLKTNSVSKQDADEKMSSAAAQAALVASAKANLDRLNQLENFKRVIAPFDGVITARNTDTGALINAGANGTGQELFHIAETDKLRAYVQLPEPYTQSITPNMKAELHFNEYPQRSFPATLSRTADALDVATRTLLLELEIDNDKNELLPGSFAEVHLNLPSSDKNVTIPVNTLLFRSAGLQVATIGPDNRVILNNVTPGRDYGKEVEIVSGLEPGTAIIVNPPDSLEAGQEVRVVTQKTEQASPQKGEAAGDKSSKKSTEPASDNQSTEKKE